MEQQQEVSIGIDVSKDRLDGHVRPSGGVFAVSRDGAGLDQLLAILNRLSPKLVVVEATGGYETVVASALAAAHMPLAVVNPRRIRDFAKALGRSPRPTGSTPRPTGSTPRSTGSTPR